MTWSGDIYFSFSYQYPVILIFLLSFYLEMQVLLTSSDAILANLTPALVAEANMLRERFARRYNQNLFGLHPRNRRGESSRRGDGLDRVGGALTRRSTGVKPVEADGSPLVDTEGLKALIRLLRVVQVLLWLS